MANKPFSFGVKRKKATKAFDADKAKKVLWDNANNMALNFARLQSMGELPEGEIIGIVTFDKLTLNVNNEKLTFPFDADKRNKV